MKKRIFIIVLICLTAFIFSDDFSTVLYQATYAKITLVASDFDSKIDQSRDHLLFNGDSGHFQLNIDNSERVIPWHNYWISWDGQNYQKPENGIIDLHFPEVTGSKTLDIGVSYWNNYCFVKSIQISKNRNEGQYTFLLDGNSQWSNISEIVKILYPYVNTPATISAQQYCYMPRKVESDTEVDFYSPIDWESFAPGAYNRSFTERTYQPVDFPFYPADEYNKNQEGKTRLYLQSEDSIATITSAYTDVMIDSVAPTINTDLWFSVYNTLPLSINSSVNNENPWDVMVSPIDESSWSYQLRGPENQETQGTSNSLTISEEGYYSVTYQVADMAGNQASITREFIVDTTSPDVTLANPNSGILEVTIDDSKGTLETSNLHYYEYRVAQGAADFSTWIRVDIPEGTTYSTTIGFCQDDTYRVQIRAADNAGNISEPVEMAMEVNAYFPAPPVIISPSHPYADSLKDIVPFHDGEFDFLYNAEAPTNSDSFKSVRWELLKGLSLASANVIQSGTTEDMIQYLKNLDDNDIDEYYYLKAWAIDNRGVESLEPSVHPFRVDSTPTEGLRIFSKTHADENIHYNSARAGISWERPLVFSGISRYSYFISDSPILPETNIEDFSPGQEWNEIADFFQNYLILDLDQIEINGETKQAGEYYVAVCAEDFAGNRVYDERKLAFDVIPPTFEFEARAIISSQEMKNAHQFAPYITFNNSVDSSDNNVEYYAVKVYFESGIAPLYHDAVETLYDWRIFQADTKEINFSPISYNNFKYIVVVVRAYDHNGDFLQLSKVFDETNQILANFAKGLPFLKKFHGLKICSEFDDIYSFDSNMEYSNIYTLLPPSINIDEPELINDRFYSVFYGSVDKGTNLLKSKFSTGLFTGSINGYTADLALLLFNTDNFNNSISGTLSPFTYICSPVESSLSLFTISGSFPECQFYMAGDLYIRGDRGGGVGGYLQTFLPVSEEKLIPEFGWSFVSNLRVTGISLYGKTLYIENYYLDLDYVPQIDKDLSDKVNAYILNENDEPVYLLDVEYMGISPNQNPLEGKISSDFYLETMNNHFFVTEAFVRGDQIIIIKAKLLLDNGDEIDIENFAIDINGDCEQLIDFRNQAFTIVNSDGETISIEENSMIIDNNTLYVIEKMRDADGNVIQSTNWVLEKYGINENASAVIQDYEIWLNGFQIISDEAIIAENITELDKPRLILPEVFSNSEIHFDKLQIDTSQTEPIIMNAAVANTDNILTENVMTDYASAVTFNSFVFNDQGLFAKTFSIQPPPFIGLGDDPIELSNLQLLPEGSLGSSDPSTAYSPTIGGFVIDNPSISFQTDKLLINNIAINLADNYYPQNLEIQGLSVNFNSVIDEGLCADEVTLNIDNWNIDIDNIVLNESGLKARAELNLPAELGEGSLIFENFQINPDGSFESGLAADESYVVIHDWVCKASTISLAPNLSTGTYELNIGTAAVQLYAMMGGGELPVPNVVLDSYGDLVTSGTGGIAADGVIFLSTNGFDVSAQNYRFTSSGLILQGKIYLPLALDVNDSVGSQDFLARQTADFSAVDFSLDANGIIRTPAIITNSIEYDLGGYKLEGHNYYFNENGFTIGETHLINHEKLPDMVFPEMTFYPDGEIKNYTSSYQEINFPILQEFEVKFSITEFWLSHQGINTRAFVNLPPIFGENTEIYFDRITLHSDGSLSSEAVVPQFKKNIFGFDFDLKNIEIRETYFAISEATITTPNFLENKVVRLRDFQIGFDGDFKLGSMNIDPFILWGYTFYLDDLGFDNDTFSFQGGIRLPYDFVIEELAGIRVDIEEFSYNFSPEEGVSPVTFSVSINEPFNINIIPNMTITVTGINFTQEGLEMQNAKLYFPDDFPLEMNNVEVFGFKVNVVTQEISLDGFGFNGLNFDFMGHQFNLNGQFITSNDPGKQIDIAFNGTVKLSPDTPGGLAGAELDIETFEFSDSGIGDVDASMTIEAGHELNLFDIMTLKANSKVYFRKINDCYSIGIDTGKVLLGDQFPEGIGGKEGTIDEFEVQFVPTVNGPLIKFNKFDVTVEPGDCNFEGMDINIPSLQIKLAKDANALQITAGGGAKVTFDERYPDFVRAIDIDITKFVFQISGRGISDVEFDGSALLNEPIEIIDGVTFETKPGSPQAQIHLTYKNNSFGFDLKGAIKLGDNFPEGLRNEYLDIESLRMNSDWEIIEFKAKASDLDGIVLPGDFIIENGLLTIDYDQTVQGGPIFKVGGNILLPSAVTDLFGPEFDYDIFASAEISATEGLRNLKFDATKINASIIDTFELNQGMFKGRYNQDDGISLVCSGGLSVSASSPLPDELKSAQLALYLEYTSLSGLKKFSVGLAPGSSAITLHPAGIEELDFSINQFSVDVTTKYNNAVPQWTTKFQFGGNLKFSDAPTLDTLPEEIKKLQLDTDFSLTIRDSEIIANQFSADCNAHFSIDMFGLICNVDGVHIDESGVSLNRAELVLPEIIGGTIVFDTPGYNFDGNFTGKISTNAKLEIAGFTVTLIDPDIDFYSTNGIEITTDIKVETPEFVGGFSEPQLFYGITINKYGMSLEGLSFNLPDFSIEGGLGFKDIHIEFETKDGQYFFTGGGQVFIQNMMWMDVSVCFTNVNKTYPIGLKYAEFEFTIDGLGVPLASTGMYLNGIRGGVYFGPPDELPQEIKGMFTSGCRIKLGVTMVDQTGGAGVKIKPTVWIDVTNLDWAFEGEVILLNGLVKGHIIAALTKKGFYGDFRVTLAFVKGEVKVYVFKQEGSNKTLVSGKGSLQFGVPRGFVWDFWTPRFLWFPRKHHVFPSRTHWLGRVYAEFGMFKRGSGYRNGLKGYVKIPFIGNVGVFISGNNFSITNINQYKLYLPSWAVGSLNGPLLAPSTTAYVPYEPSDISFENGGFIASDRILNNRVSGSQEFVFIVPGPAQAAGAGIFSADQSVTTDTAALLGMTPSFNAEIEDIVEQDDKVARIMFTLGFVEGDPRLVAVDEHGNVYSEEEGNVEIQHDEGSIAMVVEKPESGVWRCFVENALDPESYILEVYQITKIPEIVLHNPVSDEELVNENYTVSGKADLSKPENAEVQIGLSLDKDNLQGDIVSTTTTDMEGNFTASFDATDLNDGVYYVYAVLNTENNSGIAIGASGSILISHNTELLPPDDIFCARNNEGAIDISFIDPNGKRTDEFEIMFNYLDQADNDQAKQKIFNIGYLTDISFSGFENTRNLEIFIRSLKNMEIEPNNNETYTPSLPAQVEPDPAEGWSPGFSVSDSLSDQIIHEFSVNQPVTNIDLPIGNSTQLDLQYTISDISSSPHRFYDLMEASVVSCPPGITISFDQKYYDLTTASGTIECSINSTATVLKGNYSVLLHFNNRANKSISHDITLNLSADYPVPVISNVEPKVWNNQDETTIEIDGDSFFNVSKVYVGNETECEIVEINYNHIIAKVPQGVTSGKEVPIRVINPGSNHEAQFTENIEILTPEIRFIGLVSDLNLRQGGAGELQFEILGENGFEGQGEITLNTTNLIGLNITPSTVSIAPGQIGIFTVTAAVDAPLGIQSIQFDTNYGPSEGNFTVLVTDQSAINYPFVSRLSQSSVSIGDTVTIYGTDMGSEGTIFIGTESISYISSNPNQIQFTVPDKITENSILYIRRDLDGLESNRIQVYVQNEDFNLYLNPKTFSIPKNKAGDQFTLTVLGNPEPVSISTSSLSPYIFVDVDQTQVLPNGKTQVSVQLASDTPTGTYEFKIFGQRNSDIKELNVEFEVYESESRPVEDLLDAVVGEYYKIQLVVEGQAVDLSWTLENEDPMVESHLPPGLKLTNSGLIQGTPAECGTWLFSVCVSDSNNRKTYQDYQIAIYPDLWDDDDSNGMVTTEGPADNRSSWEVIEEGTQKILATKNYLVLLKEQSVVSLNPSTGEEHFRLNQPVDANISAPGSFRDMAIQNNTLYLLDQSNHFYFVDLVTGGMDELRTEQNVETFTCNGQSLYLSYVEGTTDDKIKIVIDKGYSTTFDKANFDLNRDDQIFWQNGRLLRVNQDTIEVLTDYTWQNLFTDIDQQQIVTFTADDSGIAYLTNLGKLVLLENDVLQPVETEIVYSTGKILLRENQLVFSGHSGSFMKLMNREDLSVTFQTRFLGDVVKASQEKLFFGGTSTLYAINSFTGYTIWSYMAMPDSSFIDLQISGNKVFSLSDDGLVKCFDGPSNLSAPRSFHVITGAPYEGWIKAGSQLEIYSSDYESFSEKIFFNINKPIADNTGIEEKDVEYTSPVLLNDDLVLNQEIWPEPVLRQGLNRLVYYAVDSHGKYEAKKTRDLNYDSGEPIINCDIAPADFAGYWYYTPVDFNVEAVDEISGIKEFNCSQNGETNTAVLSGYSFSEQGEYQFQFEALDKAENSASYNIHFEIDLEDPVITALPSFQAGKTLISLNAFDTYSGIERIEYTIDDGEPMEYTEPLSFEEYGNYQLRYRAIDRSHRSSQWQTLDFGVDTYLEEPWIENVIFTEPKTGQAHLRNLQVGHPIYGDSISPENFFTSLPDYLSGTDYLRFVSGDELVSPYVVSFNTLTPVDVYILKYNNSQSDMESWELIQADVQMTNITHFGQSVDLYKKSFSQNITAQIPGDANTEGLPNLVFVQKTPRQEFRIVQPDPFYPVISGAELDLVAGTIRNDVAAYAWEWKFSSESSWYNAGQGAEVNLKLPEMDDQEKLDLKLIITTNSGETFELEQDYDIQRSFNLTLLNPGPAMSYGLSQSLELQYIAYDIRGLALEAEDILWTVSEDEQTWQPVEDNTITTLDHEGLLYLKARVKLDPGMHCEKTFFINIKSVIPTNYITFGYSEETKLFCGGEKLQNHENEFVYGFNENHSDVVSSLPFYPELESSQMYYIPIKENGNFEFITGAGRYRVSFYFFPLYSENNYFVNVEGSVITVRELYMHMGMLTTEVTVTDNILTISGSTGLPIKEMLITRIED